MPQFITTVCKQLLIIVLTTAIWPATAWSTEHIRYLSGGLELSRWQEFDSSNIRLLSEHGGRMAIKVEWDNLAPRFGPINFIGRFYNGNLSYDGQTQSINNPSQNGVFIASTSQYTGISTELEATHPVNNRGLNAFVAAGLDLWRRDIQSSMDARGNGVFGFSEDYQVYFSRLGLEQNSTGTFGHSRARIGLTLPLLINEQAAGIDPELHPGRNISLMLSYRLELNNRRHTRIEFYYDSLRLSASPVVIDQLGNPWLQPKSHMDTVGIMYGIPF